MTPVERATRQGLAAIKRVAGVPVTYRRGATSIAVTAIPGETLDRSGFDEVADVSSRSVDWLIDAADLAPLEPQPHDQVIQETDSERRVYDVVPLGDDPAARWHDRYGVRWRIHTRLVVVEPL